mgnify:CR=1 FL=1
MGFIKVEDYFEEMNSGQFKKRVDAALKHSSATGNQAGFYVDYSDNQGFLYNDTEVSEENGASLLHFMETRKNFQLEYSNTQHSHENDFIHHNLIMFQTQQVSLQKKMIPSSLDLAILEDNCCFNRGYNPISILAGVEDEGGYPTVIFQKRKNAKAKRVYETLAKGFKYHNQIEVILDHFILEGKGIPKEWINHYASNIRWYSETNKVYEIWTGTYKIGEGFVELIENGSFDN